MTSNVELSEEAQAVVDKAAKLLAVAARTTHKEEAAAFSAKAMELLAAYNLDVAVVERQGGDKSGRRSQDEIRGGMYSYQRSLWRAIAELNFCMHFSIAHSIERRIPRRLSDGTLTHREFTGREFRHTLIGRTVNVVVTRNIGQYLEASIERLVRERFPLNRQRFMTEAVAFREGIADDLMDRLRERRLQRRREEQERARRAAAGMDTAQALTLADHAESERDANMDFLMGEDGYSARKRRERAEQRAREAEARRQAEAAYTAWAEAHPEEARKAEARERAQARRSAGRSRGWRYRAETPAERRSGSSYFRQGRDAAAAIGLDPQAESRSSGSRGQIEDKSSG